MKCLLTYNGRLTGLRTFLLKKSSRITKFKYKNTEIFNKMKTVLRLHNKGRFSLVVKRDYCLQQKIMWIKILHLYLEGARYLIKHILLHEKTMSKWTPLIHRFCSTKTFHLWHSISTLQLIRECNSIFLDKTVLIRHKKKNSVSNSQSKQYMKYIQEMQTTTGLSRGASIIMVRSSKKIIELWIMLPSRQVDIEKNTWQSLKKIQVKEGIKIGSFWNYKMTSKMMLKLLWLPDHQEGLQALEIIKFADNFK